MKYRKQLLYPDRILYLLLALILCLGSSVTLYSQGNLLITPRRVVFDGSSRSIDLNLANTGADTATYAISMVQIRMTAEGGFESITEPDPGQRFADRFIRFFPRSVTLGPGEAQLVKVQVTRRSQLERGEYRSHFYFRAEKAPTPLGEEDPAVESNSIAVKLTPVFGITIPVIIRVGDLSVNVEMVDINLDKNNKNGPMLSFSFLRKGEKSVYGDLEVKHIAEQGTETRVAIARGIAVYTPNQLRKFQLNLQNPEGKVNFNKGKLVLIYSAPSDISDQEYARTEFVLKSEEE